MHANEDSPVDQFVEYYERQSLTPETRARFETLYDKVVGLAARFGASTNSLDVADIGCGAASQCMIWARKGHRVHGLDINAELIEIGRRRAAAESIDIELSVGSATALPWSDASFDVALAPELLEHVPDWRSVLNETVRILRPGGIVYLSTTNTLCPRQQEFDLPLYSWYPGWLKRRCERMSVTSHPEWVSHAKFPAVNWFTPYGLARELEKKGFDTFDRFDLIDVDGLSPVHRIVADALRTIRPLRFFGHMLTPGTTVLARKR